MPRRVNLYRNPMAATLLSLRVAPMGYGRENGLVVANWLAVAATDRMPLRNNAGHPQSRRYSLSDAARSQSLPPLRQCRYCPSGRSLGGITRPVLPRIAFRAEHHVDVGIFAMFLVAIARADGDENAIAFAALLQVLAVARSLRPDQKKV